ncbi:hypothetical protein [Pseudoxanthomonas composti]|uniref:Uncharacterized protein n=1 Tax=Pseudoxanthomonas composti TaxID=2137479 RepID=A0A4Q1JYU6_9GAMM|nr:hypothetical protein [Pseudoxanthomonas composti]RXR08327.1 hypothetical protein EPA99_00380 [Pseudoxanthomonas composti]
MVQSNREGKTGLARAIPASGGHYAAWSRDLPANAPQIIGRTVGATTPYFMVPRTITEYLKQPKC